MDDRQTERQIKGFDGAGCMALMLNFRAQVCSQVMDQGRALAFWLNVKLCWLRLEK